jgi:hypothetical protein
MKTRRTVTLALAVIALAILATFTALRDTKSVQAQDQIPPPVPERLSFGTVGITSGQSVRISVANTIMPNDTNLPPGPTRVVLNFRGLNGQLVRNQRGEVIRKTVDLERGDATFLDLSDDELPPGPSRMQVRPVVTVQPPPVPDSNAIPYDSAVPVVEVINNANGRTVFALSVLPAVQKLPPPVGD